MRDSGLWLKVWRLHPNGCAIADADRDLRGEANPDAARFCGPFTNANRSGWWLYSPVDIDITWLGGDRFEHRLLTPYSGADFHLVKLLLNHEDAASPEQWTRPCGRTKFTWGMVEPSVAQIWTGCIFQTPPGWGLHIRSPINCAPAGFHVMEAVLETDWLQYDIWLNLVFHHEGQRVELRRNGWPPVAQLVPTPRQSYAATWDVKDEMLHRRTPEANEVFEFFVQYNEKKFAQGGKQRRPSEDPVAMKDSTTYYRERRRTGGAERCPVSLDPRS